MTRQIMQVSADSTVPWCVKTEHDAEHRRVRCAAVCGCGLMGEATMHRVELPAESERPLVEGVAGFFVERFAMLGLWLSVDGSTGEVLLVECTRCRDTRRAQLERTAAELCFGPGMHPHVTPQHLRDFAATLAAIDTNDEALVEIAERVGIHAGLAGWVGRTVSAIDGIAAILEIVTDCVSENADRRWAAEHNEQVLAEMYKWSEARARGLQVELDAQHACREKVILRDDDAERVAFFVGDDVLAPDIREAISMVVRCDGEHAAPPCASRTCWHRLDPDADPPDCRGCGERVFLMDSTPPHADDLVRDERGSWHRRCLDADREEDERDSEDVLDVEVKLVAIGEAPGEDVLSKAIEEAKRSEPPSWFAKAMGHAEALDSHRAATETMGPMPDDAFATLKEQVEQLDGDDDSYEASYLRTMYATECEAREKRAAPTIVFKAGSPLPDDVYRKLRLQARELSPDDVSDGANALRAIVDAERARRRGMAKP